MNIPLFNASFFKATLLITSALLAAQAGAADPATYSDYPVSAAPAATNTNVPTDAVANSVVKIFSAVRYPDFYKPWSKQAATEMTGSGVVIDGKRILTCAHVVMYASQIQVQANQSGDKLPGKVEAIAPGIDLAIIKLDDETFFDTHPPLEESRKLPQNRDMVMAYGYPLGGTSLSITKGIVSRIEFTPYNYPVSGLRVQVDAAINPGNSGGPAVVDDKMIGLAFSRLGGAAQNVGYIIPCEEIDLFLQGLASGHYEGKPMFFDYCQALNAPLRSFLKLTNSVQGIVVNKIADPAPDYPLKKWDLITKIGDASVDDLGMVSLGNGIRVFFKYMCQKTAKEGKVPLTLIRAGKSMQVQVPVKTDRPMLLPQSQGGYPSYFIFGPMVFSSASLDLLDGIMGGPQGGARGILFGFSGSPLVTRMGDDPSFQGESLVVVPSPFFPSPLTETYTDPSLEIVKTVNDIPVKNLNHLVEILRDSKDEFITIEFYGHNKQIVVLRRADALEATDGILSDNGVRMQGSPDTMAIWNAKAVASK